MTSLLSRYPNWKCLKRQRSSLTHEYETDVITLFHAAGDFTIRHRWREGVKSVEEVSHFLPRVGMRCRCILESGEEILYTTGYSYHPHRIEYSETDEQKETSVHYLLERSGDNKSRLTLDFYVKKNFVTERLFNLFRKKSIEEDLVKSMQNLVELVKQIRVPEQILPHQ